MAGAAAAIAAYRPAQADSYAGPLVDAHAHLSWSVGVSVEDLLGLYDGAGVKGAHLFGEPWQIAADGAGRRPQRVVPYLAEGYANALHPDSSFVHLDGLEQLLSQGVIRGLGEIILRHSAFQLGASGGYASAPENDVPADDPLLIEAYRLAGRYGAPVNVHQEWFFADELERAAAAAPDTTFVWAHGGHGSADVVRGVLSRHPNVLADLSARTPWLGPGTVLLQADGRMVPAWRSLLHEMGDRFLVGFDLFVEPHYQLAYVRQTADYYRGLLGQLEDDVAEAIGHLNAERLAAFAA